MCRGRKFLIRVRSIFLMLFFMISLGFRDVTHATAPTHNELGCYVGTVSIDKANLQVINKTNFKLPYNGEYQILNEFKDSYENKGTVYYKIGDNGTWVKGIPSLKDVDDYDLYYYVEGDENHNDLRSSENPLKVTVNIYMPKEDWGTEVKGNNGIVNYITDDGMTSAEVTGDRMIWVREESIDHYDENGKPVYTSAWYGVDNSSGVFAKGSRLWVKWLHREYDKEEYQKYFEQLDDEHKERANKEKLWIFITGVTGPDGQEYTNLDVSIPYYIQLGDDWGEEDVNAWYISTEKDEQLRSWIATVPEFMSEIENINFPVTSGKYAQLLLKHFSPYAVYDVMDLDNKDSTNITNEIIKKIKNIHVNKRQIIKNYKMTSCENNYMNYNNIIIYLFLVILMCILKFWHKQ